jgi:O-antigen ligase
MPDNWSDRMATIGDEQADDSVMGRFSAWWVAWGIGWHYPFGVGFNASRPELFAAYSPYPQFGTPAAHSIYFQVLGHHGFIGLFIYIAFWVTTWRVAAKLRKDAVIRVTVP